MDVNGGTFGKHTRKCNFYTVLYLIAQEKWVKIESTPVLLTPFMIMKMSNAYAIIYKEHKVCDILSLQEHMKLLTFTVTTNNSIYSSSDFHAVIFHALLILMFDLNNVINCAIWKWCDRWTKLYHWM